MSIGSFACAIRFWVTVLISGTASYPATAEAVHALTAPGQTFNLTIGVAVTNGVPGSGAGVLAQAQEVDVFSFTATAGQKLFFRDLGAAPNIDWALFDSNNQQIFRDRIDAFAPGNVTFKNAGAYQVRVLSADGTATGNYSFVVLNAPDQIFDLTAGTLVTNDVPGAGAGRIESPGQLDIYRIQVTAGEKLYFEDLGADPSIDWALFDTNNQQIFRDRLDGNSPGRVTVQTAGIYELRVLAAGDGSATGNYSFALIEAPDEVVNLAIGLTVTNGVPAAGSGRLDVPGGVDVYRLTPAVGQKLFFYDLGADPNIDWGLYDTNNQQLFRDRLDNNSPGWLTFQNTGPYELRVFGAGDGRWTGRYSFAVLNAPDDVVDLPIGTTVTNGVPSSGSGRLATPGNVDVYRISGAVGQKIFFRDLGADPHIDWAFYDTNNVQIFRDRLDGISPGRVTLQAAVPYELRVFGSDDAHWTGQYSFSVLDAPDDVFNLPLNVVITNGVPGPGAGVLETPGRVDVYRLTIVAGQTLYFNDLGGDPGIDWGLYDTNNAQIFRDRIDGNSPGRADFPNGGAYEIHVFGAVDGSATGRYSIEVVGAVKQEFAISVGTVVTNNVPGPGAGVIDTVGAEDFFNFQAPPNRTVYFRDYGASGAIDLVLLDDTGATIGLDRLDGNSPKNFLLTKGGNYQLIVRAGNDGKATGSYSFGLLPPAPVITRQPQGINIVAGRSASFSVSADSDSPIAYQWRRNGTPIPGETNAVLTLPSVTPDQVGDYSVALSNTTDTTFSDSAHLDIRQLIAAGQAARTSLPPVPGNGVAIELFNGIGGGAVPTPDFLINHTPDGATLSPVIDFPHPGTIINVGNSFDTFFSDTATPPDAVRNLSASNFILRHKFFLRVSRDLDQNPATPEIDLQLGVGSDDGFYLMVGTNVLGGSGDRSFTYTWMPVAFETEGLYPVNLLYAANAVGQSGLELSWITASNAVSEVIPQSALYVAPNIGDQLITFEELPVGAVISNQFASRGISFQTTRGSLQVTTNSPDRFVPVSPTHVYADAAASPTSAGELDLQFVTGSNGGEPAITDFVSFFLLNAQNQGAIVTAFNTAGGVIYSNTFHAGGASQDLVTISQPRIARVHIALGSGSDHAAIDNLSFTTPRNGADLAVGVRDVSANAVPGGTLSITWAVTNVGITEVKAPWGEQVFLSAPGLAEQILAAISSSNDLAPGAFAVRTQAVAIPFTGLAGTLRAGVRVDAFDEIAELDEGNNVSFAASTTDIPQALLLDTADATTTEGALPLSIRLVRNGDVSGALTVALSNSNPAEVTMPTNVVFAAGQSAVAFNLQALTDGVVDGSKIVALTATANGYDDGTLSIVVQDADVPQLVLTFPFSSVVEGNTLVGTVGRAAAASSNAVNVFVHSSLPARTQSPDFITLPAGATNASFQVTTVDDGVAASPRQLVFTAEAAGYVDSVPQSITLLDRDLPPVALTLSRAVINEGDGSRAAIATISRSAAAPSDLAFEVRVSDTNAIQAAGSVVIPAGDAQASFTIGAIDDHVTNASRTVTIQLFPLDPQTGQRISDGVSTNVVVTDNDGPALTVAIATRLVGKGLSPATTGTVTRRGDLTSPLNVALTLDDKNIATVPSAVTIAAGQASGTFPINTLADSSPGSTKAVNVTASAPGLASGTDTLIVSDVLLPDLIVTNVSGPTVADTESFVSVTYRVVNEGFANFHTNVLTRIFLSTSPGTGNDLFADDFTFTGSIPPSEFFEQSLQVRLPTIPGDYWIIATTDLEDHVPEIIESNNTTISATPIHVREAYTATATTDASTVPAGTPITFRGHAVKTGSAVPAAQVPVDLHLLVRDTQRVLLGVTDDEGNFTITFTPLPNEAGNYSYAASHPGTTNPVVQGHFTIVGLIGRVPEAETKLIEDSPLTLQIPLENLSDRAISGLQARVLSAPSNVSVTSALPNPATLPGFGAATLTVTLRANDATITSGNVILRVTSSEGATTDITIAIAIESNRPRLVTNPSSLLAGMKRGVTTSYDFDLINSGGTDSGPIVILPPALSWLRVVTPSPLPSLAAGQSNRVTLQMSPAADLPLGDYQGAFVLRAGTLSFSVPFNFRALSEAKGDLRITAVDEYTYYAEGSPPVTNATVIVRDAVTGATLTNGVTDLNGQFVWPQIFEGYYDIQVDAGQHIGYHDTSLVRAGITNDVQAFLSRETVRYIWTVVPTEIEDRTTISIETEFETFVPIPVVTIEPAAIDLALINADVTQIDLRISNHGLISANDFQLSFSSHPDWQLEPLVSEFGSLPARSSLTVPLTIRRLKSIQSKNYQSLKSANLHALSAGPCSITGGGQWDIVCGTKKHYSTPIQILNVGGNCPTSAGGSWGGSGTFGAPYVSGPTFSVKTDCSTNDCVNLDLPKIDISGLLKPLAKAVTAGANVYLAVQPWNFFLGLELEAKPEAKGQVGLCCKNGQQDIKITGEVSGEVSVTSKKFNIDKTISAKFDNFDIGGQLGGLELTSTIFVGTKAVPSFKVSGSYTKDCQKDKPVYELTISGGVEIKSGLEGSVKGKFTVNGVGKDLTAGEVKGGLAGGLTLSLTINSEGERKLCYKSDGMYLFGNAQIAGKSVDLFTGGKYYLIDPQTDCSSADIGPFREILAAAEAEMDAQLAGQRQMLVHQLSTDQGGGGGGVCARIRLKLDQDLILTRNAFNATLEILNNDPANPIEDLSIQVGVLDAGNNSAGQRFDISTNQLQGVSAVDGTGVINKSSTGTASFLIIPGRDAAPDQPTIYKVGGILSYTQGGRKLVVPLTYVPITVLPDPRLFVKYFHQRDVYADDPFTPIIEPSVPYSLAVMIQNVGKGEAKNVHIASAQPQIVDNEKGLLIDFKIIGSEVAGQPANPSLTVDFGTVPAGSIAIGRWLLTSTLQGLFDTYSATIEHTAGPQDNRSSLIDDLSIHEMIHLVQAPAPFDDGKPDFLVNDDGDADSLPDSLYLSDGSTNQVSVVRNASVSGVLSTNNLSVQITTSMPDDWTYLLVGDPGQGKFRLKRVVRSDNREIPLGTNVWATDRTFIGKGRKPIYENLLHLFDYKSPGVYTLFYDLIPPAESIPPVSSVNPLPPNSYTQIPVSWSGSDNPGGSGIGFYDIYVSVDVGPYLLWLGHTDEIGAVYSGELGKKYAFYSVATDNVGNREKDHTAADAQTTVTLVNHPPTLASIPNQRLNEGQILTVTPVANDPDSDPLTWSLVGTPPPGLQISSSSGLITWITGAGLGPSTNRIVVQALDNGIPRLGALQAFNIILDEVNFPPEIQPVGAQTIREGQLLQLTNIVNDPDWPPQTITFKLTGAPAGVTLDAGTGVLRWRPNDIQGGSNYLFNIVATDSGSPNLSSTQAVAISVVDTLSDFTLTLGSTNVTAGTGSYLPIYLQSVADITNVVFDLTYPNTHVTNLTLQPVGTTVGNATFENVASNHVLVQISAAAGKVLPASGELARLLFLAGTNQSTVLPFEVTDAHARGVNGAALPNGKAIGAPVFLVRDLAVLGISLVNRTPSIALYSPAGQTLELQYKTNLNSNFSWISLGTIVATNQYTPIPALPALAGPLFLRVQSLDPNSPRLVLMPRSDQGWDLFLSGKPGNNYKVQSRAVRGELTWQDEYSGILTNALLPVPIFQKNDSGRIYRGALQQP